jgi:uncharacterized protein YerC
MPQISRYPLDKNFEKLLFEQFWALVAEVDTSKLAASVFSDLFTTTEQVMFAKRLAVAVLLVRGKSPTEIRSSLKVSFTTIGSVASWTQNVDNPTRKVLERMAKQKRWGEILDKIEEWIDSLPPVIKTSWREVGKRKVQRRKERIARARLR